MQIKKIAKNKNSKKLFSKIKNSKKYLRVKQWKIAKIFL